MFPDNFASTILVNKHFIEAIVNHLLCPDSHGGNKSVWQRNQNCRGGKCMLICVWQTNYVQYYHFNNWLSIRL